MTEGPSRFPGKSLPARVDAVAPDGSEIRLLVATERASMCHCTLAPGAATRAARHRTVEEVWFVLGGTGEVMRRDEAGTEVQPMVPGLSLAIPLGVEFQFRTLGDAPLTFLIVTTPPWPGPDEAVRATDHWPATTPSV